MKDEVIVYGASDDLIEIEGSIREEFNRGRAYLGFSDGSVLFIEYGRLGEWAIRVVAQGSAQIDIEPASAENDTYSDKATLIGEIKWVVVGGNFVRASK